MARALRAWAINRRGKTSFRNLRYGPRTRLVRGMYVFRLTVVSLGWGANNLKRAGRVVKKAQGSFY